MAERTTPQVTLIVAFGGLSLERTVAWRARVRARRAMVAELEAALAEHEALRPRVDTVGAGFAVHVPHPWNDDDARGPRPVTGFTCRTRTS